MVQQTPKDSSPVETLSETSTPARTPSLTRRFSSQEGPAIGTWTPSLQTNRPSTTISSRSVTSPVFSPKGTRCQSPMASQTIQFSNFTSTTTSTPSQTFTASSPWGSRCQSPIVNQNTQSSSFSSIPGSRPSQTWTTTSPLSPTLGSRCQSPVVNKYTQSSSVTSMHTSKPSQISAATSPCSPPWRSRSLSPAFPPTSLSFPTTKPLYTSSATSPVPPPKDSRCMSPTINNLDSKANHRLLAKNIINAAKRKNSPSPGAVSAHSLPISPLGKSHHGYDCHKPPISPFQSRALGAQSPTFTSPPPTPTQRICSPVRFYNTRSLTDSDASVESEDSGHRSPGLHSYNTCPRGWGGSLRVKRSTVSTDL